MPLGVKALATYPLKSAKRDKGLRDVPVSFAGVTVKPGDWVYADKVCGAAVAVAAEGPCLAGRWGTGSVCAPAAQVAPCHRKARRLCCCLRPWPRRTASSCRPRS